MRKRAALLLVLLAVIVLAQCLVTAFAVFYADGTSADSEQFIRLRQPFGIWIALIAGLQTAVFFVIYLTILKPLNRLAEDAKAITKVNPSGKIDIESAALLEDITDACNALGNAFLEARRATIGTASAGSQKTEEHEVRLDSLLKDLKEGIVVCDEMGRILRFNAAARRIVHDSDALRINGSLYAICARQPIENAIELLHQELTRSESEEKIDRLRFRCSALDGSIQLSCCLHLLPSGKDPSWYFVMSFEDMTETQTTLLRKQISLVSLIESMRSPLANLRASAEGLAAYRDVDPQVRTELEGIILSETERLSNFFQATAKEAESIRISLWAREDILSTDLLQCAARHLQEVHITLTFTGHPLWVNVDDNAMILLIEFVARRIAEHAGVSELEVETLLGDKRTYFAFMWKGMPIPEPQLSGWSGAQLVPYPSSLSVADVLRQHDSEMWSKRHQRDGYATLVLPVPFSQQKSSAPVPYPSRPIYTSLETFLEPPLLDAAATQPLSAATFVAFDIETTGLLPAEGDRIVAIAGVVMTANRIFIGDVFHSLVNPGRLIPGNATRVHGITNEMVSGQPSVDQVLKAFQVFAADAVLVGYDTAFDMSFIRSREAESAVRLRNPVLDILLLSMAVHSHTPEHSLDAIARRLGIDLDKRHTALGDAFITAQIFSRLLPHMEERGIVTLGQAYEASRTALKANRGT